VQPAEDDRSRDFQSAARRGILAADLSFGAVDVLEDPLAALQIEFATRGQPQRSGGAQQKRQAELVFELGDGAGDDRWR